MIRRHVLIALAAGIAAGDEDAARLAVGRIDWVLRGRARRLLEQALIGAALDTDTLHDHDLAAARHLQRVAALGLAQVQVDVLDREQVTAAYAALPAVRLPGIPLASVTLVVAVLVAGISVAWAVPTSPAAARTPRVAAGYVRPLSPPVAGAFKDGGVPLRDAAIETLLVDDFTTFVLETDSVRRGVTQPERAARGVRLQRAAEIAARGPALVAAWTDMLATVERWVLVPRADLTTAARELRAKVRVVSDQLAAQGIGIYLEGSVLARSDAAHAVIYSYRVEQVVFVVAAGEPRRVLSLRRLDRLNLTHSLLGMQSEELGDPVLLLDQIDEHVSSTLLPLLAPDATYALADGEWADARSQELALAAGAAVRREIAAAFGSDAAVTTTIATLLARRTTIVDRWRTALAKRNIRMAATAGLYLPPGLVEDLARFAISEQERDTVGSIETELHRLEAARIADRLHALMAATVRRHEAQHGLDDDRSAAGSPPRYPPALEALLGAAVDRNGMPRRSVEHTRAELAAYLSQIANDPVTPQLALWHVARSVFHRRRWGTPESYAGVLIVEGLARQLGARVTGPVIHDGTIDRERLRGPALALAVASDDELRAAARALWVELYAEPSPVIVDR